MRFGRSLLTSIYVVAAVAFAYGIGRRLLTPAAAIDSDFMVFRSAWWLVLHDQGAWLYDAAHQRAAQQLLMQPAQFKGGMMAFLNPPHVALAGLPFGWMADRLGLDATFAMWTALNIALAIRLARQIREALGVANGEDRWSATFALLAFFPLFYSIFIGQLSVLLAVAAFECHKAIERKRVRMAALWLLVLGIKPQLAPPFLVLLAIRREWGIVGWTAVFSAIAVVASAGVLGPSIWLEYFRNLHSLERFFAAGTPEYMMNVRGALTRAAGSAFSIDQIYLTSVALWLLAMGALAAVLRRRLTEHSDFRADFSLTMAVALFFCPHLFPQDALLWVVPLILYVAWLKEGGFQADRFQVFVACWPLVFIITRALDMMTDGPRLPVDPALLAMMAALAVIARQQPRRSLIL